MGLESKLLVFGTCSCLLLSLAAGELARCCKPDGHIMRPWYPQRAFGHAFVPWVDHLTSLSTYPVQNHLILTHHYSSPFAMQLLPLNDFRLAEPYHRLKYKKQVPTTMASEQEPEQTNIKDQQIETNDDKDSRVFQFDIDENSYSNMNLKELFSLEAERKDSTDMVIKSDNEKLSPTHPNKVTELLVLHIPDYEPNEITVRLKGRHLHIAGKHIQEECEDIGSACVTGQFQNSYRIPPKVDSQFMSAKAGIDGYLRIYSHLKDSDNDKLIEDIEDFEAETANEGDERGLNTEAKYTVKSFVMKDKSEDLKNIGDVYKDDDVTIEVTP